MDRAGLGPVRRFFQTHQISNLVPYIDEEGEVLHKLGAAGLPTTLLIDSEGREMARLIGPADWDSPDLLAFIKATDCKVTRPMHFFRPVVIRQIRAAR